MFFTLPKDENRRSQTTSELFSNIWPAYRRTFLQINILYLQNISLHLVSGLSERLAQLNIRNSFIVLHTDSHPGAKTILMVLIFATIHQFWRKAGCRAPAHSHINVWCHYMDHNCDRGMYHVRQHFAALAFLSTLSVNFQPTSFFPCVSTLS